MASGATEGGHTGNPLHVAIILSGLGAGGAERVVSILSRAWVETGHRVTVVCFDSETTPSYYPLDPRIVVRRLGMSPYQSGAFAAISNVIRRVAALRKVFADTSPDVIISFLSRTSILTLLSSRGMNIPVIVSERNNPYMQNLGTTWNLLRRLTYPRAYGMVTMTNAALRYFPERMRARSWVIPNPVILVPNLSDTRKLNSREEMILTAVGRLVHQKGFDLLLEAFAKVTASFPAWKLVIWGEGPERASLELQRTALGLDDSVLMPGISEKPGGWIANSNAFVLSSRYEGWGNALSEAMSAGLPVISFDCPWGPSEMIQDGVTGILVANEDSNALSMAMIKVMGEVKFREQLGAAAFLAAQQFSHVQIFARWNSIVAQASESKSLF